MRPLRWIRRQFEEPIAGREHSSTTVCGLLLALAAGLILTSSTHPGAVPRTRPARGTSTVAASGEASWRWRPADAAAATASARRFLDGYLPCLYGQTPVDHVKDATAGFLRGLQRERRMVPPGITALHPHLVAIHVSPQAPGQAVGIALVSDGEVVHYPIRLLLAETGKRWLVGGLEGAR
jgi:hypothetical protein